MKIIRIKELLFFLTVIGLTGCDGTNDAREEDKDYGVFLSLQGREAIEASEGYDIVIIDAQNLSADEITEMKGRGQEVYSYLNIGSLETFRPYYEEFQHLILKPYDNWEDEFWIDVTDEDWQEFIAVILANELLEKEVDGFWVDNADVYGQFFSEETHAGVDEILKSLMIYGKPVIINGGDQFIKAYLEQNQKIDDILTGVNQETVFSAIDFEETTLDTQTEENRQYYLDYLNRIEEEGKDVFLLEYVTEEQLTEEVHDYATERGWKYYISDSIELDGNR